MKVPVKRRTTAADNKSAPKKSPQGSPRSEPAQTRKTSGRNETPAQVIEFHLRDEFVELCNLLKLVGIADSGGRGKQMVAAGMVRVDGQAETRKTAKIRAGQRVDCGGVRIAVVAA